MGRSLGTAVYPVDLALDPVRLAPEGVVEDGPITPTHDSFMRETLWRDSR